MEQRPTDYIGSKHGEPIEEILENRPNKEGHDKKRDEYIRGAVQEVLSQVRENNPDEYGLIKMVLDSLQDPNEYRTLSEKEKDLLEDLSVHVRNQLYADKNELRLKSDRRVVSKDSLPEDMPDFRSFTAEYSDDAIAKIISEEVTGKRENKFYELV